MKQKNTCFYNVMEAITENINTRNAVETNKLFKPQYQHA